MGTFVSLFNNREKAIAIWLVVGLIVMLFQRSIRHPFQEVLRCFFRWKMLIIVLPMLLWVGLEVFGVRAAGLWDTSLLKDTILWTLGVAFVLLINTGTAAQDEHYFRKVLLDNAKVALFLEFIVNLYTFNLWVEIILLPALFLIGGMSAVAESNKKYLPVKRAVDFAVSVFGMYLIGFAIVSIVRDYRGFASIDNLRSFLLPLLLTAAFVPFLYMSAVYASYETLSMRLFIVSRDNRPLARYAKRKTFGLCFLNLRRLNRFMKEEDVAIGLMNLKDRDDVVRLIQEGRKRGL